MGRGCEVKDRKGKKKKVETSGKRVFGSVESTN